MVPLQGQPCGKNSGFPKESFERAFFCTMVALKTALKDLKRSSVFGLIARKESVLVANAFELEKGEISRET